MNIDQQLDARQARRQAAHARAEKRLERREAAAAAMIGELADGRCYVWPVRGQYREGDRADLIAFLLRNRYV